MSDIIVYTFAERDDSDGVYYPVDYSTQDYQDADAYARKHQLQLIENTFVWDDSEVLTDYSPEPEEEEEDEEEEESDEEA